VVTLTVEKARSQRLSRGAALRDLGLRVSCGYCKSLPPSRCCSSATNGSRRLFQGFVIAYGLRTVTGKYDLFVAQHFVTSRIRCAPPGIGPRLGIRF